AVHSIPVDAAPDLEDVDQVARYRDILDQFDEPHPAFELGFRWLEANRPPSTRTSIVHGDFRLGNLIVGPDGLRAVLDWEIAHLGAPMEDRGGLGVQAWRFGAKRPVGGFGDYDDLFAAYRGAAGVGAAHDAVGRREVLGT